MTRTTVIALLAGLALLLPAAAGSADDTDLWRRLQDGGYVLLVRHAATDPGVGDPPGFKLEDCATQRNLSAEGRRDAEALGAAFRAHRIPVGRVLTSRWCRCVDTARLAFGASAASAMLNSGMGDDDAAREAKVAAVRQYAAAWREPGNVVLVTHDVNIRALVGERIAQGETVVTQAAPDGTLVVVGKLGVPGGGHARTGM